MSRENVETIQRLYDALNQRDLPAVLHLMAPGIELRTTVETYRGIEGVESFMAEVERTFEDYTATAGNIADAAGHVVVDVHQRGRGRESGIDIDHTFTHVWKLDDGLVTSLRAFTNRADALEAVGLGE
jgi:ketosteroid isomerase-like protein